MPKQMYAIQTRKTKIMKLCRPGAATAQKKPYKSLFYPERKIAIRSVQTAQNVCMCVSVTFSVT